MHVNEIDKLIEAMAYGGGGADEENAPEPLNKRFQWKDPKTGKKPRAIPPNMLPDEQDVDNLEPGSSKRFDWKDPKTGAAPEPIPADMRPTEQDLSDLEGEVTIDPEGTKTVDYEGDVLNPEDLEGPDPVDMTDRKPVHSFKSMMEPSREANMNDLLDRYNQMSKTHGRDKAKRWMDTYRQAEFESALQKIVDNLLLANL